MKDELIIIRNTQNKTRKSRTILILIVLIFLLPNFTNFLQGEFDSLAKRIDFEHENPKDSFIYYSETEATAYDVYISGNYAYIADGWKGLAIIDITDPTNPGAPVYRNTYGDAQAVYVSGNYAYIADYEDGLAIIDISDPENPGAPVYMDTECAMDVYVKGDYAYVADEINGLAVIDISDPTNPGTPVYMDTSGWAWSVEVRGNYAYVADGYEGLSVINITDPTDPSASIYSVDTDGFAQTIFLDGCKAFVADGSYGLAIIDVTNPINPQSPDYEDSYTVNDVFICGDYAYLATLYGMAVFDIMYPNSPNEIAYKEFQGNGYGYPRGIDIEGNYGFVPTTHGLMIIDISVEVDPVIYASRAIAGEARKVDIDGFFAYIAADTAGLAVMAIIEPFAPSAPIYENTAGHSNDVEVDGDWAYIADGGSGLAIIDVSSPTNPKTPIYMDTSGYAHGIDVCGDYAYVASGSAGVAIIDISDPTSPGTPVYMDKSGDHDAYDVFIDGDYAYVAYRDGGIAIFDISDPTSPGPYSTMYTNGWAWAIEVRGDYAYVADDNAGLTVIDVSDPTSPSSPTTISTAGTCALDVDISGDYAYVADGDRLTVIDIKQVGIANPTILYSDTIDLSIGVDIIGDHAFVASRSEGLVVVQVRERADLDDPIITENPSDLILECGYTDKNVIWMATDDNPYNYTIELQGSGVVAGPFSWSSGVEVTYDIPDGLGVGTFTYTINFTDDNGNFAIDTVNVTVQDTENPIITFSPSDKIVGLGYSGETFQWTATDENPYNYTIELQGSGNVVDLTGWSSGISVIYDIPEGFSVGEYFYTINFTDDYGHFIEDTVKLTVQDIEDPIITDAPSDIAVELGYTGINLQWNATDDNPYNYTIELQGSGVVVEPTAWSSGVAVNYTIPDGFPIGDYYYIINYTDSFENFITDTVKFTVGDSITPIITDVPEDYSCFSGYTDVCLIWIATDAHPATYTIEHQGHGILTGPISWTSGSDVSYTIPEGLSIGEHFFTINFTDLAGNYATDTVKITIQEEPPDDEPPPAIPFGNWFLVFMIISIIGAVVIQKRKQ
jgi:hypothetical protein